MGNTEPIRMDNGGVPRFLTLDLMRHMRRLIYQSKGLMPDEIRCAKIQLDAYEHLFPERERRLANDAAFHGHAFDGIPMLVDVAGLVPADRMEWLRKGWGVIGVLDDLWIPHTSLAPRLRSRVDQDTFAHRRPDARAVPRSVGGERRGDRERD